MTKTIIMASHNPKLVKALATYGFRIVDSTKLTAGQSADAYLYTGYRPDTDGFFTAGPDPADISIGNYHYTTSDHPATVMLNITGLNANQIADILIHKLAHRPHR